jgi:hypothetical protein
VAASLPEVVLPSLALEVARPAGPPIGRAASDSTESSATSHAP